MVLFQDNLDNSVVCCWFKQWGRSRKRWCNEGHRWDVAGGPGRVSAKRLMLWDRCYWRCDGYFRDRSSGRVLERKERWVKDMGFGERKMKTDVLKVGREEF